MAGDAPAIVHADGSAAGAVLSVLSPSSVSDTETASYLIQAFSDDQGSTKVGEEVKGVSSGGTGVGATPFLFAYSRTTPAALYFRVTVAMGDVRSPPSNLYGPVVVGE